MRWKSARESEEFSPLLTLEGAHIHSNGSKENRTCETNDSAMKQKAKNINIDYIVFLNTTDDDDFFNTTRFFLSFFLSFFLAAWRSAYTFLLKRGAIPTHLNGLHQLFV